MTRRGLEIRVGIVVVLASVILVVGIMWFQKFKLVEKRYSYFARFGEVGGLQSNDPVYVNGVERGRVGSVKLSANAVIVEMGIREGVAIPADSHVRLKSVGIMGERFVEITKGASPRSVAPGDTVDGEFLMGLSEVMGAAGEILDELAETSRNLREILETFSNEGKLQSSVDDLSAASANLRSITDENQPRLANAIQGIERVSTRLDGLTERHYASLDSSLAGIGRTGQTVEAAVQNLAQSSEDLKEITRRLREGEGTIGKLLSDDELIDRLNTTLAKLDSLITDIKLHPGRYVTLELF
jgi:phospholipid/cholesterol/gamma-HCH transport system substrate-binding protein